MKRGMIGRSIFALVVFTFLISGVFAALPDPGKCIITARAECTGNNHIVMGLSSLTNSHGESASGSYGYVLCCAFGTGITTCNSGNTNAIIELSSSSNAHAESTDQTAYSTNVCYEDLRCVGTTASTCQNGSFGILSLSSSTNAHIGAFADYPVKICCSSTLASRASCVINSVSWAEGDAIDTEGVEILVTGNGADKCDELLVSFDVQGGTYSKINQPKSVPFNGNTARGRWISQHQAGTLGIGDVSYKVNASITLNPAMSMLSSNSLTVKVIPQGYYDYIKSCSDYNESGQCNSDVANIASESSPSTEIDCSSSSTICSCLWTSGECKFSYSNIDSGIKCTQGQTKCYDSGQKTYYCYPGSACPSGDESSCNSDGTCDSDEGCTCADCSGKTDSCADALTCSGNTCGGTGTNPTTACTKDSDCSAAQNCILGICHTPIHVCTGVTCPSGTYCRDGTCGTNGTTGGCTSDNDCGTSQQCIAGGCFIPSTCSGVTCPSPSSCMSGTCVNDNATSVTNGCNYGYTLCNNVGLIYCYPGSACPAGQTPGNNNGVCDFGFDGCSSSECAESDRDTCATGLYCLNKKCSSVLNVNSLNIENCRITQTIEKDCNTEPTGYKTITWKGTWLGNTTSGAAYNRCITGGTDNVPCPAEIQLPFFDYLQLGITLIIIAGIYVSLVLKSKVKRKK
jgi:hypothetical protein